MNARPETIKATTLAIFSLFVFLTSCMLPSEKKEMEYRSRIVAGVPIPQGIVDALLEQYNVPAVSIATIRNGQIDWVKAYGVRKFGSPITVDSLTLFQAASISKPVSAAVALRLVDLGQLSLDEDVNKKLTSWQVPNNVFTQKEPVTLRRLLSHSAGLPMHGVPEFHPSDSIPSLIQILNGDWYAATESIRPVVEPGSVFRYSGGGYIVLQVLLEDITGRSFEDLADELILQPAVMTSSTFKQPLPEKLWSQAAVGHLKDRTPVDGFWHVLPEQATGGLWTTPKDLAHFMIELRKSYKGISDNLLPQDLAREMLTRQIDDFGLGFSLPSAGVFRFTHSGGTAGYRCFMVLSVEVPEGVVIMTNGDSGEPLLWRLFELIANAYDWEV